MFILRLCSGLVRVLFCLFLTTAVSAQNQITLTADRQTLTVGDPIEISIAVAHPPDTTAQLAATDWGAFELLAGPDAAPSANGTTLRLRLTLWAPGAYELPPLPILLTQADGQSETAVTNPLPITVTSVLTADDRELRDIRPQMSLPQTQIGWPWLLLLAVGLVAGGTAVWHLRRPKPITDPLTAQAEALAALGNLGEPEPGKWAAFATAVLHILRRFLQQTTAIPAEYRTTAELAAALPHTPLPAEAQAEIVTLLQKIDAVRFAPQPETFSAAALTDPARRIILRQPPEPDRP
ncbi:MAG: hypothetical protein R3D55_01305 [Chloroflexota bacterium]